MTPAKARPKKVTKVEKPTPAVADNNRNRKKKKKKKKTFSGTYSRSILISRAYQKMMKLIEIEILISYALHHFLSSVIEGNDIRYTNADMEIG